MIPKSIKAIGVIYILGGIIRITYVTYYYVQDRASDYILFIYLFFFGFSIISGLALLFNNSKGIYLSLFNSSLQTIYFSFSSFTYLYSVLFTSLIYIDNEIRIKFIIQLGGALNISYFPDVNTDVRDFGINIIPIIFTLVILNHMKNSRNRDILIKAQDDNAS